MDHHAPPAAYHQHVPAGTKFITGGAQIVRMFCRGKSEYGCAIIGGVTFSNKPVKCLVVTRNDVSPALHQEILNHEIAHCNGMRHP